jgi:hypothetical protein
MTSLPIGPATPLPPPDWLSGLHDTATCARYNSSVPHPARVYAYWLGGKDHYRADREAAEEVIRRRPQVVAGAHANRAFLARAVRYLAGECGIRQFLDIGTGLPGPRQHPPDRARHCPRQPHRLRRQRPSGAGPCAGPAHQWPTRLM